MSEIAEIVSPPQEAIPAVAPAAFVLPPPVRAEVDKIMASGDLDFSSILRAPPTAPSTPQVAAPQPATSPPHDHSTPARLTEANTPLEAYPTLYIKYLQELLIDAKALADESNAVDGIVGPNTLRAATEAGIINENRTLNRAKITELENTYRQGVFRPTCISDEPDKPCPQLEDSLTPARVPDARHQHQPQPSPTR